MQPLDALLQTVEARLDVLETDMPAKAHDATQCPLSLLGHLAWARGLDYWSTAWPEATKRELIRQTPANLRRRGTRAALDAALAAFAAELRVDEWWEQFPVGEPGTARATFQSSASIASDPEAINTIRTLLDRESRASVHWTLVLEHSEAVGVRFTAVLRTMTLVQLGGTQRGA